MLRSNERVIESPPSPQTVISLFSPPVMKKPRAKPTEIDKEIELSFKAFTEIPHRGARTEQTRDHCAVHRRPRLCAVVGNAGAPAVMSAADGPPSRTQVRRSARTA